MKRFVLSFATALLVCSCANSRGVQSRHTEKEPAMILLTVKNTLHSTATIFWQRRYGVPHLLGKVKAGKQKRFVIKGGFYVDELRLIARPLMEQPLYATVREEIAEIKKVFWELSQNAVTWKRRE